MATEVIMPKLGLTMTEGTVEKWYKKEGDKVEKGEPLFSVATDKLTNDVECDCTGTLLKIITGEGDTADCKSTIAYIGAPGEKIEIGAAPAAATVAAPAASAAAASGENSIVVIGGGPGGYVAAIRAAQLGVKVTLIEKNKMGGTCLNVGCIPTKAILHSAELYAEIQKGAEIGINAKGVTVDWEKVMEYKNAVSTNLSNGVSGLMKMNKVKVIEGEASFTAAKTLKIIKKDGSAESITSDKIIIAAGSVPAIPPIPGVKENKNCIDSTGALSLPKIPKSMVVIGGGVIGIELASAYSRFGTKITIVEMLPKLLPMMDGELTNIVQAQLAASGVDFHLEAQVLAVEPSPVGAKVKVEAEGREVYFEAEKVLVAVGRRTDTAALNLDAAGLANDRGRITVNDKMETNIPGVYAIGDCIGKVMLAHTASAMGEVAAENAMGKSLVYEQKTNPSCVYVSPEFAGVGLTEEKAKEAGIDYKVGKFPMAANGKAMIMGCTDGMVKVIADKKYGEILGVHILGPRATDLIAEAAIAIRLEATVDELVDTIHAHPTVAEAVREAALATDKRAIHSK